MKILATKKSKLIPRVGRSVTLKDEKIAIFTTSEGKIYALADYCPLTKGPILEGMVAGDYRCGITKSPLLTVGFKNLMKVRSRLFQL